VPALIDSVQVNLSIRTPNYPVGQAALPPSFDTAWIIGIPSGSLRIGGDAPNGLVLNGLGPVSRTIRLYDRETGALVDETISAGDGTYAFTGLSARTQGYDVQIMGISTERDIIIPRVHPG
jgi:hypothetical protein